MASFAKIILVGNVGRDPETRQTQGGSLAQFTMAVNENRSGNQEGETTWYRITFWGRQAETIMQHVKKGSQLYIEGRLSLRKYTNKDGIEVTSPEITGTDFQFVGSRTQDGGGSGGGEYYNRNAGQGQNPNTGDYGNQGFSKQPPRDANQEYMSQGGGEDDDLPF